MTTLTPLPVRRIAHPGPVASERVQCVAGDATALQFTLQPGCNLIDAIGVELAAHGFDGAVLELEGGALSPFQYVMPAMSSTPEHAVYYSRTYVPEGVTRLERATVTFGRRNGEPFLHCHALWHEADGTRLAGHVLPHETHVAAPIRARAWAFDGMAFHVSPDAETNFSLFQPLAQPRRAVPAREDRFFAIRLRPNQDLCGTLEHFCAERGIRSARIRGGVGSVIGAEFDEGHSTERIATELLVRDGRVSTGNGTQRHAEIDVVLVDDSGVVNEGVLTRGSNPVLVTVELLLEKTG